MQVYVYMEHRIYSVRFAFSSLSLSFSFFYRSVLDFVFFFSLPTWLSSSTTSNTHYCVRTNTHTHERICRQFRWKNNEWRMVCIWWFFRIVSGGAVSILFTYRHPSLIPMFTHARLVSKGNPVCLRAFGSEQCAWDQLDKRKLIDG